MSVRIAVLIACHNRRQMTLSCLGGLFRCELPKDVSLEVFLVDDGSTDGTADSVLAAYPEVNILTGDGSLYWNGGMRKAFAAAMTRKFDYYLWLNDDTFLYSDTIRRLINTAEVMCTDSKGPAIVVGSTQAEKGGGVNHGGVVKWTRLNSKLVEPGATPIPCETMFGNCVLIPDAIARTVGNLDSAFVHSIGDVDYGLRARKAGFSVVVMPGFAGICELNPVKGSISDTSLSMKLRYRQLLGPKGLPPRPLFIFLWRHMRVRGILYGIWIYVKVPVTWMRALLVRKPSDEA